MENTTIQQQEPKWLKHHVKKITQHITRRNALKAKLFIIWWFISHYIIGAWTLKAAVTWIMAIWSAIIWQPFAQSHANLEPVCGNFTIEWHEVCDWNILASWVVIQAWVPWSCSDTCSLTFHTPKPVTPSVVTDQLINQPSEEVSATTQTDASENANTVVLPRQQVVQQAQKKATTIVKKTVTQKAIVQQKVYQPEPVVQKVQPVVVQQPVVQTQQTTVTTTTNEDPLEWLVKELMKQ